MKVGYETPRRTNHFIAPVQCLSQYLDFAFQQTDTECSADVNDPVLKSGRFPGLLEIENGNLTISFPETSKGSVIFTGTIDSSGNFAADSNVFKDKIGPSDVCDALKTIHITGVYSGDTLSGDFVMDVDLSQTDPDCSILLCNDPYHKSGTFSADVTS